MSERRQITEQYRLDKQLRSSAHGSVFRATDLRSGEVVAVKLLAGEPGEDSAEQREQFLRTARALQALAHPSLPRVLDFGFTTAGSAFLVTEYLHGPSLADFAGSPPARALALLLPVAGGLAALDAAGIATRNLRADNLLVVPGAAGERVGILGIGAAALLAADTPAAREAGRRADLKAFAAIACQLLGATCVEDPAEPRVELPPAAAGLAAPEALRSLLAAALRPGAAPPPPSYAEVQHVLNLCLGRPPDDGAASYDSDKTVVLADLARRVPAPAPAGPPIAVPASPRSAAPPAATTEVTQMIPAVARRRRRWPLVAAALAGAAVLAAAGLVLHARRGTPAQPAAAARPGAVERRQPAPVPSPPPPSPPPPATPPVAAPPPSADARRAADLHAALAAGEVARLRGAVAAFRPEEKETLAAETRKDLDRATRALKVAGQLEQARQAGRQEEALQQAAALVALLPGSAGAREARAAAAAAFEAAADAAIAAGRFDAARQSLASLRQAWPQRAGLRERGDRLEAESREDQRLQSVLDEAARAGKENRPVAGMELLAGARPNARFEPRFRQAQAGLEAQLARLDRSPPTVALRGTFGREYEKDASIKVPLRIADDLGVVRMEFRARAEGSTFAIIPLRHLAGSDYEAEIPAALHQNKPVEFYVTADDYSGHQGQLGSAASPQRLKPKKWYSKILGERDPG
jgi:eukaryotic-like serine/threonine-protein kinase